MMMSKNFIRPNARKLCTQIKLYSLKHFEDFSSQYNLDRFYTFTLIEKSISGREKNLKQKNDLFLLQN